MMDFYTVRDLRTTPKSLWDSLTADGEVVITNNGRPTALMLDISDGTFEESLKAVRQAKNDRFQRHAGKSLPLRLYGR